jgi:hypothetical protein
MHTTDKRSIKEKKEEKRSRLTLIGGYLIWHTRP